MALPTGLALAASLARGVYLGAGLVGGVRFGEVPLGTQLVPGLFPCVPDGMDCTKVILSGGAVRHSLFSWHFSEEKLVTCHGSHTLGAWPVHKKFLRRDLFKPAGRPPMQAPPTAPRLPGAPGTNPNPMYFQVSSRKNSSRCAGQATDRRSLSAAAGLNTARNPSRAGARNMFRPGARETRL